MAWRRISDKPLPEPMIIQFTGAYTCTVLSQSRVDSYFHCSSAANPTILLQIRSKSKANGFGHCLCPGTRQLPQQCPTHTQYTGHEAWCFKHWLVVPRQIYNDHKKIRAMRAGEWTATGRSKFWRTSLKIVTVFFWEWLPPARHEELLRKKKRWLIDAGHNSRWHMKCAQQAAHAPNSKCWGYLVFQTSPVGGVKVAMALQRDCEIVHVIIAVIEGLTDGHANMNHKRGINS